MIKHAVFILEPTPVQTSTYYIRIFNITNVRQDGCGALQKKAGFKSARAGESPTLHLHYTGGAQAIRIRIPFWVINSHTTFKDISWLSLSLY
jgi:hypothetical protein